MQQQIPRMVANRVPSTELVVHPEREVGERARLQRAPYLPPAGWRSQAGIDENGVVIQVEGRGETGAKGNERDQEDNNRLSQRK